MMSSWYGFSTAVEVGSVGAGSSTGGRISVLGCPGNIGRGDVIG